MRKNVLVHRCGEAAGCCGKCDCGFYVTAEEATRRVSKGTAQYAMTQGALGRLRPDFRAIIATAEVPAVPRARMINARDIERAYVEVRRLDSERIECFAGGSLRDRIQFCEEV